MTENNKNEIILTRSELVYVLHELNCKTAIGIELEELRLPDDELNKYLDKGKKKLKDHSLFPVPSYLNEFVKVIGDRDMGIVIIRGIRSLGRQLFIFNFYEDQIVEHTMPEEGLHRLAVIESFDVLIQRLRKIVPLAAVDMVGRPMYKIAQPEFEAVVQLAQSDNKDQAEKILIQAGLRNDYGDYILKAIETPEFTLSMACFLVQDDTAISTSSASIFADQQSSWGIWPYDMQAKPPILTIFPSGITDVFNAVKDWYDDRKLI